MTRFNISLEESVNFVIESLSKMIGGEIFVPKLPSYNIVQLANVINNSADIDYIGITLHVLKYFDIGIILNNILSRIFRDVYSLIQTFKYLDDYFIFNLSQIIKKGSSSKFFTEEVLGFYIDGHSSGTTFLNDSLMSFGLIGLFLFPLLLITFIGFLEYLNLSIFYKSFFMFYIFIFIQNGFLNFFIKVWPFVFTFFVIIVLHLSRRLIYKRQSLQFKF